MTMRLCDAIRLGATMRPKQAFGVLYYIPYCHDDGYYCDDSASCALGAAAEGLGISLDLGLDDIEWRLLVIYPYLSKATLDKIIHLNDRMRWTREAIADWLESQEPQERKTPKINVEEAELEYV